MLFFHESNYLLLPCFDKFSCANIRDIDIETLYVYRFAYFSFNYDEHLQLIK